MTGPIAAMLEAMHGRQEGLDLDANITAALGNASVRVFERSGHTPFVEESAAFDEALESFSKSVASQGR